MANVSLQPAPDGPSHRGADRAASSDGIYVVGDKSLVDRHAALQLPVHRPAVLPDRATAGSPASCATSPTRRPPPTSGARWRPSAARRPSVLGGAFNCGKAQPGRSRRSATAARPRCSAASTSSTPRDEAGTDDRRSRRTVPAGPRRARAGAVRAPTTASCIVRRRHQRQPALGRQHADHQRRDARRRPSR